MTDTTASTVKSAAKSASAATAKSVAQSEAAVAERAKAIAGEVGAKAQDTYEQVRRVVADRAETARDWATDQSDVLRDTVQTKPFISIGVSAASAFAAGLVLGILLTRR